jgi:N-acetylglucosaminyl-diphospho-decaprenol L-rhamnosyltransferase
VDERTSIVVLTHNRCSELLTSLAQLTALPSQPSVIVVDNASSDGTRAAVAERFPRVVVIEAGGNLGAAGRNLGVDAARTPYVALADDDTWWTASALERAAGLLDVHPRLAIVSGRVLVGADHQTDPVCPVMARSPLVPDPALPGPRLLGFLAGASMVRRSAFLAVGGFERRVFLGGEERLLAADLAAAGWGAVYADDVVVHHHPSGVRDAGARRELVLRNDLWFAWRRRSASTALAATGALAIVALRSGAARRALVAAVAGLPWALATRRALPDQIEADFRALESSLTEEDASTPPAQTHPDVRRARRWLARAAANGSSGRRGA